MLGSLGPVSLLGALMPPIEGQKPLDLSRYGLL